MCAFQVGVSRKCSASSRLSSVLSKRFNKVGLIDGISHGIIPFMSTRVRLDNAGRVVIPKPVRDELGLAPGDTLALESDGLRVTMQPVRSESALRKEQGVWVFRNGRPIQARETDRVLEEARAERGRPDSRRSSS